MDAAPPTGWALPERALRIRRGAALLCRRLGWAPLHEVALPNGRRADILALCPDGAFVCIEVKSGPRDFLVDAKWPDYRAYCDALYFAVDAEFPLGLLPHDVGLMVAEGPDDAALLRPPPVHPLAGARRRALLLRFAMLAAERLAARDDPAATLALRVGLRVE